MWDVLGGWNDFEIELELGETSGRWKLGELEEEEEEEEEDVSCDGIINLRGPGGNPGGGGVGDSVDTLHRHNPGHIVHFTTRRIDKSKTKEQA